MVTHRTKKDPTIKEMLMKNSLKKLNSPKHADTEDHDEHTLGAMALEQESTDAP